MPRKPKLIAIVGPTSSGKTDLSIAVARLINGEIISTDSRQIYRELNIGAGKVTKKEMHGVPHHLLNIANAKRTISVAQYQRLAKKAIQNILKKNKTPILCGGTGLYVDSILTNQSFPAVPPNTKLRKVLAKLSATELFNRLNKIDPARAKTIDAKNPHRLIRAIEIATALGSVPLLKPAEPEYESLIIGLTLSREELQLRIHKRLMIRLRRGMVAEARNLHAKGLSWKRMEALGLDYRYLAQFLQGKIQKNEMIHRIEKENWLYAKRQMVWFKRNKNILWFSPKESKKILTLAKNFITK